MTPHRLAFEATLAALLLALAIFLHRGARGLRSPLGAFLLSLALFCANTRPLWSGDTEAAVLLSFALVRDHTFALDGVACTGPDAPPMYAAVPGRGGELWSRYPIMMGLLAFPLELPAALSSRDPCTAFGRELEKVAAAILAALVVALIYSTLRALVFERVACLALAAWVLGTAVLPTLGQALWQHTGSALGAALALHAMVRHTDRRRALQVGLGIGLVVACRPPDLPIALALLCANTRLQSTGRASSPTSRARLFLLSLAATAPLVVLQLGYQWQAFGGPLRSGYGDQAVSGWGLAQMPNALAGLLISPGRGLLVWSPILLIALLPVIRLPQSSFAPALRPLAAGLLAQLLLVSCWWAWDGGSSFGPRMLSGGLPLFAPLLALAFSALQTSRAKAIALLLTLASILPNALLTFAPPSRAASEAIVHLHAPGGAFNARAWPPIGYLRRHTTLQ